jgi:NTP pyrophosphatase (non-canonical NTP hydrolase)
MSPATAQRPPLLLSEYFANAAETDQFAAKPDELDKLRFGFYGEVGGLLAAIKKVLRDQLKESETEVAAEEIGDALWYLVSVAHALEVEPEALGAACMKKLRSEFGEQDSPPSAPITFRNFDGIVAVHHARQATRRTELLGCLAKGSGDLMEPSAATLRSMDMTARVELLGNLMASLVLVASSFSLALEELARDNVVKTHGRWPGKGAKHVSLFDDDARYPQHEQLPRDLKIDFIERDPKTNPYVVQQLNGVFIGDRLTDNNAEPDDYRFHDVFHLAYVAHLGWSPVIRALLKRKRKSRKDIDENEDGARAMIIEEGIATWIFNHAKKRGDFFDGIEVGKLEYGLLKQVQSMVTGYEVDRCPLWQWEKAILDGFQIFREIRKPENRGGSVRVNMLEHTIIFAPRVGQS